MCMTNLIRLLKRVVAHGRITPMRIATTSLAACLLAGVPGVLLAPAEAAAEQAEEGPTFGGDGAYMGGRGVYGIPYFVEEAEDGWGFGVWVGYRTHGFFAGEIEFEIMDPGFKLTGLPNRRNFGMTLYAKAYPMSLLPPRNNWLDRLQPYAKMGGGFQYWYTKSADDLSDIPDFNEIGFVGRFGGGLEIYLSTRLALTFDATYVLTTGPIAGLNSWSVGIIGLQWRFRAD
jgi:hypothetical protein